MVDGIVRFPLRRFEDERGWLMEIRRESALSKPTRQTNVSFSRAGGSAQAAEEIVLAALVVVQAADHARVVVLDRQTGEAFTEDIGDDNQVAIYIPGRHAHGFEALTDLVFCYHVTEEYDPDDPDEHGIPWDDPRVKHLWSISSPVLSARDTPGS